MKNADWWTMNLSPWSGCLDLALPPEQRQRGCEKCWLPALLSGPRGKVIHKGRAPHEIVLHPERLAQALKMRAPQRWGWINGEVADVARLDPEYLAACAGVVRATPHHGYGVPTSDPAGCVEWARWLLNNNLACGMPWQTIKVAFERFLSGQGIHPKQIGLDIDYPTGKGTMNPRNWLWLISASTQQEVDERLPHALELGRLGWRWGIHAEPMLEPLAVLPDAYGMDLRNAPSWIVVGAAKGHRVTESERGWYTSLRDQAAYAGVPYWLKSSEAIPGESHVGLPAGWPGEDLK